MNVPLPMMTQILVEISHIFAGLLVADAGDR